MTHVLVTTGGAALAEVAKRLKQRTAVVHERVEAALDLLDPGLTPERLSAVLERFYGFWQGTEPAIDSWARAGTGSASSDSLATALDWGRRRRSAHLSRDLRALGVDPSSLDIAPPAFQRAGDADVLGWLYVAEGSTLGGAVIDRKLRAMSETYGLHLESFTPYAEGPGPMWLAYLRVLDDWVAGDAAREAAVVDAGLAAFEALETWLEPLDGGVLG